MLQLTHRRFPNGMGTDPLGLRNHLNWFFEDPAGLKPQAYTTAAWMPAIDIYEDGESYRVVAEIPGVSPEDIGLSLENNVLTVRGQKTTPSYGQERYHRRERSFGTFERSFTLPNEVDTDSVQATYENGVLTVSLIKPVRARAREIPVRVPGTTTS